jgi:hypothetical protein
MKSEKGNFNSFVFAFILFSCASNQTNKRYENYLRSTGTITYVRPARLTNHGMVDIKYDIKFVTKDGKEYTQTNCDILHKNYSVNDTLTIYYNPENPSDPLIDRR